MQRTPPQLTPDSIPTKIHHSLLISLSLKIVFFSTANKRREQIIWEPNHDAPNVDQTVAFVVDGVDFSTLILTLLYVLPGSAPSDSTDGQDDSRIREAGVSAIACEWL